MTVLPGRESSLTTSAVYGNVTDRQTDGWTSGDRKDRAYAQRRSVNIQVSAYSSAIQLRQNCACIQRKSI